MSKSRPNSQRILAGWIAFGVAAFACLVSIMMSPMATAEHLSTGLLPTHQIYMTGLFAGTALAAALLSVVLLLPWRRSKRGGGKQGLRHAAIVLIAGVIALVSLFQFNWLMGLYGQ